MLKIKRPTTAMFELLLEDGDPENLTEAFSIYVDDNAVLSFVTDKHIIFLSKEEVAKCFKIFTASNGDWADDMEETVWADTYSETFAKRVLKEMDIKKSKNPYWFYPLVEAGYDIYYAQYFRKDKNPCEVKEHIECSLKGLIPYGETSPELKKFAKKYSIQVEFKNVKTTEDGAFTDILLYDSKGNQLFYQGRYPLMEYVVKFIQDYRK